MVKTVLKIVLPLILLAACVAVAQAIVARAPAPVHEARRVTHPPVRVAIVEPVSRTMDVVVHGLVRARTEISIVPQVSGRVVEVSPALRVGGFFDGGDVLVRIDRSDHELAKTRAAAAVAQAGARLDREVAEAEVVRREWEKYGKGEPNALVLHGPQLAEARALLASAEAGLAAAELDLERTVIHAPFDGRVRTESIDVGQFLSAGVPFATVFATDHGEVRLAVPVDRLAFLDLPLRGSSPVPDSAPGAGQQGDVVLRGEFGGRRLEWRGTVVRTEAELDSRSRVLHVFVRVEDPYARLDPSRDPLLVGMFVEAVLPGRTRDGVFVLSAAAIRDGDRVAVVDADDRLRLRPVTILRREGDEAIVSGGIASGDRVCLTRIETVVDGMRVRVETEDDS